MEWSLRLKPTFLSVSAPITEANLERKHGEVSPSCRHLSILSLYGPALVLVERVLSDRHGASATSCAIVLFFGLRLRHRLAALSYSTWRILS